MKAERQTKRLTPEQKKRLAAARAVAERHQVLESRAMKARFLNMAKTPAGREMLAHFMYISGAFRMSVQDDKTPPTGRDFGLLVLMNTGALEYQPDGYPTWDSFKELVDKMLKD